ncbi:MAG TPA: type ISP restriction/modification enzyme [Hanamia sp.]|nr:type ISP restriction/modification enzyme [Hanamia sp.]
MSEFSIKQYQNEVEKIIHFGGTKKETAIRNAFYNLLNEYASQKGLMLVTEIAIKATNSNKMVTPDGTLKDILRQDWGYWESKDESDDLNEEIIKKFDKGYPKENILFEDSQTAVLIQNGNEVMRVPFNDIEALHRLLTMFVSFERPEVIHFRKAIEHFKEDIPKVTETIRSIIIDAEKTNPEYIKAAGVFLKLCHDSINPAITIEDVREMIIQHILTEDIFNTIFDETQFHRENNIARELETVIHTFFTGNTRRVALSSIKHYYDAINAAAAGIADHHEKQKFLKVVYETFYKSYNPKAADRLGVVYTPNEIVRFMIESTDYLLNKHFKKYLEDKNVEILDPATGTGTFICDIIDYLRKEKVEYKYKNEIHANEVAILPYYISNLNIEFTYTQKMGKYAEFENLCFVDTLDNMGFAFIGKQIDMFAPFTEENSKRIKKQNSKRIAVIIGNPPYNANQANENDNNKNREYPEIDKRIKDTFIKYSTAQKTKLYDMYARFYRWAFDRLDNNGVIAFITNRSFIDSRTFDGFRKTIQNEFEAAYIIDTKSDVRANPKIAGTTHNVFGIQTGVAIMFLIKKFKRENVTCKIHYTALDDFWKKEKKLQWLSENSLQQIPFEIVRPDKKNNWINIADNDFESLLPLENSNNPQRQLFLLISNGVNTARDEWVFSLNKENLINKVDYFIGKYNGQINSNDIEDGNLDYSIKWSEALKNHFQKKQLISFDSKLIREFSYRPFYKQRYYAEKKMSDRLTSNHYDIFGKDLQSYNLVIPFSGRNCSKPFTTLATQRLFGFDYLEKTQCLPLFYYDSAGKQIDNISNWGFNQFVKQYGKKGITKEAIFHYVYAVLHNPAYKKKYELNLKREFPRIPFYENFNQWNEWGKALMNLHINYEMVQPFELKELSTDHKENPKAKLKADKENGSIILDENTILTGIPKEAWTYKLGNRSALEWVLDQYKEKKPKDPTIAEKFDTYKFADYKQQVIDLLKRICTVSVETMKIIEEMNLKNK